jgi:hypothetical protein
MRSHRFRNEIVLATGLLVILLSSGPAGACGWRCDDRFGNWRAKGPYGYQPIVPRGLVCAVPAARPWRIRPRFPAAVQPWIHRDS